MGAIPKGRPTPETVRGSKVSLLSFIVPTSCDEEETLQSFYDGIREQAEQVAPFMNRISQDRTSSGDRWQKILPRGILRRIAPSRKSKSTQAPRAMLPG